MLYRRLRQALPWIGATLLGGCVPADFSVPVHGNECRSIPLARYVAEQQSQVADEMAGAPAGAQWPVLVGDYGRERAMLRACQGAAK